MKNLVIFLEELSAKEMLKGLLPRVLPGDITPHYIVFEGKQDLERQLERRVRGWCMPNSRFLVLRDQDSGDCLRIKTSLSAKCASAGRPEAVVRVACHELESWYLGDLRAVEAGLKVDGLSRLAKTAKFRDPDRLANPSVELEKLTRGVYQKVSGSRAVGPCLSLEENRSRSFRVFLEGIRRLIL